MTECTPTDEEVAEHYIRNTLNPVADRAEFDRWLTAHDARVRRDAAREALDGLASEVRDDWSRSHHWVTQPVEEYRDTHYPEETP